MKDQNRLLSAYLRNKERKAPAKPENLRSKAKGSFAVVTSLIAFVTSLTALGTFKQSDDVSVILSNTPEIFYDTEASKIILRGKSTLTFVNAGDRIAAITSAHFTANNDDDLFGICGSEGNKDNIEGPITSDVLVLKPGEITAKNVEVMQEKKSEPLYFNKTNAALLCLTISVATPDSYKTSYLPITGVFLKGGRPPFNPNDAVDDPEEDNRDDSDIPLLPPFDFNRPGPITVYKRWGTIISWLHGPEHGGEPSLGVSWSKRPESKF